MKTPLASLVLAGLALGLAVTTSCSDATLDPGQATPDGGPAPDSQPGPVGPAARGIPWAGVYDSTGVWDLSGPIGAHRTLGTVVAESLVDEIVTRAGVPSALQGRARDVVSGLIASKVKALVDSGAPAALKPDSELMKKLGLVLTSTEVASTIELVGGGIVNSVKGSEEVQSFTFTHQGARTTLPVGDLLQRTVPLVTLGADWKGRETAAATLTIDPHDLALRLGKLMLWVVENVIQEQGGGGLAQAAAAAISCDALVAVVLDGKASLSFGVGSASFAVNPPTLLAGCGATGDKVKEKALGLFDVDSGVRLGGVVQVLDDNADQLADRLLSKPVFNGSVTQAGGVLAPQVKARFEARRRPAPRAPIGVGPYYGDLSNTIGTTARLPLRGRIIKVPGGFDPAAATPFSQVSQEELPLELVTVTTSDPRPITLGTVTTDDEGYIDQALDIASFDLAPGNHLLRFMVRGTLAGVASARLLAGNARQLVVRSDVDLTYLDTDFMSTTGKLKLVVDRASDRRALPAMELLYRALRRGGNATEDLPLSFLSGSPSFFKMVLEEKMRGDEIAQDGVVLKPFKDIIADKITDLDLGGIVPALEEQVGYKLSALLRLRLDVPPETREILMGDDSEADAVAYLLYHQFTSGALSLGDLMAQLQKVNVDASWTAAISALAMKVSVALPATPPVIAIYINQTGKPNPTFPVADWTVPNLTHAHAGAWPLALDLFEEGHLTGTAVAAVRARLLELGQTPAALTTAAQAATTAGYLRAVTVTAFQ